MRYVFLGLYIAVSTVHLVHSWQDNSRLRAKTKAFLLFFLILFYLFSARDFSWFLLAALVTSWIGDILLIFKGHGWFTLGGVSFLLSHFFFILTYLDNIAWETVPWLIIVPIGLLYFFIAFRIIRALTPTTPHRMIVPMYLYLLANSTMNLFALMQLFTQKNVWGLIAFLGALLFFVSDCTLFLVRYHKNRLLIFKRHFTVMLTYLLGELLIVIGVLGFI